MEIYRYLVQLQLDLGEAGETSHSLAIEQEDLVHDSLKI